MPPFVVVPFAFVTACVSVYFLGLRSLSVAHVVTAHGTELGWEQLPLWRQVASYVLLATAPVAFAGVLLARCWWFAMGMAPPVLLLLYALGAWALHR